MPGGFSCRYIANIALLYESGQSRTGKLGPIMVVQVASQSVYFLIDFIPLVQTVSLHQILLFLTAQQEHFEFDSDEFNVNIVKCMLLIPLSYWFSKCHPFMTSKKRFFSFLHYSLSVLAALQLIKGMFNFTRIHRKHQRILFHGYQPPRCRPNPRYTTGADFDQH